MSTSAIAAEHPDTWAPSSWSPGRDPRAASLTYVAIVHGQRLVRDGLRTLLERETGMVVIEAATGDEAVMVTRRARPDVVLIDVEVPGLNCVETTRRITAVSSARVVLMTTSATDPRVFATLAAGAAGLVCEDREPAALVRAVRRLGGPWRPRRRSRADRPAEHAMASARVIDISQRR
jgi:prevent-host-death family protein